MGKNSLNIYPVKLSYDEVDTIKDWKRKYLSETNGTIESAVISNVLEQIVNAFSEVIEIDTDEDTGQKVITVLFPLEVAFISARLIGLSSPLLMI